MSYELVRRVLNKGGIKGAAKWVLAAIADKQPAGEDEWCFAAGPTLAKIAGISPRSLQYHLKKHMSTSELILFGGKRRCENGFTNQYKINEVALDKLPDISPYRRTTFTGARAAPVKLTAATGAGRSPAPVQRVRGNKKTNLKEPMAYQTSPPQPSTHIACEQAWCAPILERIYSNYPALRSWLHSARPTAEQPPTLCIPEGIAAQRLRAGGFDEKLLLDFGVTLTFGDTPAAEAPVKTAARAAERIPIRASKPKRNSRSGESAIMVAFAR